VYELEYGFSNSPEEKKTVIRKRISDAQKDFPILPLTAEGAELFGNLKTGFRRLRQLNDKRVKSHNIDLMIAATAISEECILVSLDSLYPDVQRLHAGLKVASWR
jgi:predicted nucleic acid-binding protein